MQKIKFFQSFDIYFNLYLNYILLPYTQLEYYLIHFDTIYDYIITKIDKTYIIFLGYNTISYDLRVLHTSSMMSRHQRVSQV